MAECDAAAASAPILSEAERPLARVSCASTRSAPATNALAVSHNTARLGNLSVSSERGSAAPSYRPGSLALPSSRCGSLAAGQQAPKPDFDDLAKNVLGAVRGLRVPAKILAKGAGRAARDKAIEWAERSLGSGLDKVSVSVKTSIEADPEPPAFVRGFFVNVWETLWGQLRDPLAAYLLLEFGKLAGEFAEPPPQPAKRHAWYDLRARWRRTRFTATGVPRHVARETSPKEPRPSSSCTASSDGSIRAARSAPSSCDEIWRCSCVFLMMERRRETASRQVEKKRRRQATISTINT